MKADVASAVPAILAALLVLSAWSWVEIFLHRRIHLSEWLIGTLAIIIFWASNHFLVVRGSGPKFDDEFSGFSKRRQLALYLAAVLVNVAVWLFLLFTVKVYQRTFGIWQ